MMVVDEEGFVEVICGPMFSGKTTELIKRINFLKPLKLQFLVFKPFIDNRYSCKSELINHNLETAPAILIRQSKEIFNFMKSRIDLIIIDEAQFLDSDIETIVNDLSYKGIRIIIAGLELDFRGRPFGSMPYLLSIADRVTKYRSYCFLCGKEKIGRPSPILTEVLVTDSFSLLIWLLGAIASSNLCNLNESLYISVCFL
ncbi:MAG: thymidine kinase [Pigeon pea little leaf phytoplasma]|nr:thymidine kinase [Pigeon pea little leaf phytoplasma]